ncbi:MAG TPA: Wzz/FepE/Etk N-terminal domain-containing protein [bacterium]|nr:Wzz/FepE/Etk N-terminal domain-containing protein [bacterium]
MLDNELQSAAPPPATIPAPTAPEMDEEEIFSVRSLHEMFMRHIWGFSTVATVVLLLGIAFIYKDPPVYQSNSQVKVEEKKQVFTIQEFMDFENVTSDFYRTQVELLKSRELCRSVIEMLELGNLREFLEPDDPPFVYLFQRPSSEDDSRLAKIVQTATEAIRRNLNQPNKALSSTDISPLMTALVNVYEKRLTVESNRKTPQLIDVHFRSHSPFVAATIANIHTQAYPSEQPIQFRLYRGLRPQYSNPD